MKSTRNGMLIQAPVYDGQADGEHEVDRRSSTSSTVAMFFAGLVASSSSSCRLLGDAVLGRAHELARPC